MPLSRHRRRRGRAASRGSRANDNLSLARPRRKKINKIYLIATITIAVLVIGSFGLTAIPFRGGGGQGTGSSSDYVDGIGVQQTIFGNDHVSTGQAVEYASFPPTSGDHWPPESTARCGFNTDEVPDERVVHNMEHSNIIVNYNLATEEEVDQLRQVMGNIGLANVWGITRPYSEGLGVNQIALTAWGVIDIMDGINPDRIEAFFDTYAGVIGPESFSCLT